MPTLSDRDSLRLEISVRSPPNASICTSKATNAIRTAHADTPSMRCDCPPFPPALQHLHACHKATLYTITLYITCAVWLQPGGEFQSICRHIKVEPIPQQSRTSNPLAECTSSNACVCMLRSFLSVHSKRSLDPSASYNQTRASGTSALLVSERAKLQAITCNQPDGVKTLWKCTPLSNRIHPHH